MSSRRNWPLTVAAAGVNRVPHRSAGPAGPPRPPRYPLWLIILIGIVAALIGTSIANALGVGTTRGIDWIEPIIQVGNGAWLGCTSQAEVEASPRPRNHAWFGSGSAGYSPAAGLGARFTQGHDPRPAGPGPL